MEIVERRFRGSVICRALGYPISYGIAKLLLEKGKLNLEQIARSVKRSKSAVCFQLTKLRLVNIIRYKRKGKMTFYWIKYPEQLKKILVACEQLAGRASQRLDKDY
jgi:predicted transcriptional regulator